MAAPTIPPTVAEYEPRHSDATRGITLTAATVVEIDNYSAANIHRPASVCCSRKVKSGFINVFAWGPNESVRSVALDY